MTLSTVAFTVTAAGASAPSYAEVLSFFQDKARSIFGSDIILTNDSKDGQLLAVFAKAIGDVNQAGIAVYNQFSPATAIGEGLSSVVKINGIRRQAPSFSSVDVVLSGDAFTPINNGLVADGAGVQWALPSIATIGSLGTVTVTATCTTPGAITAAADTVTNIMTPTLGWQSVTNPAGAAAGQPVETDAQLRQRQTKSTRNSGLSIIDAILETVLDVPGVQQAQAYENDTGSTDSLGLPAKSMAFVVSGGDAVAIATAIMNKKNPGPELIGTTTEVLVDAVGISQTIKFTVPTVVELKMGLTLKTTADYTTDVGTAIKGFLAQYVNALPAGQNVSWMKLVVPALLIGSPYASTYTIEVLTVAKVADALASADVALAYTERPHLNTGNITLTLI